MKRMKTLVVAIAVAMVLATGQAWAMSPSPTPVCTLCSDDFNNAMGEAKWMFDQCMTHTPGPVCFTVYAMQAAAAEYALAICEAVVLIGG